GVWLAPEEQSSKDISLGEAKDESVEAASLFIDQVAPDHQPKEVEATQEIIMPNVDFSLLGRIDLITDKEEIVDLKTGKKSLSQADVDASTQLSFYDLTYRAKHKRPPAKLIIEQIVSKKKGAERNTVATTRDSDDLQALVNRINTMAVGLKAGVFIPATPGAWWCGAKFCGYFATCSYVNNKKSPAGIS
ncbi:MAG: PD-(D/E)XK nuclease family protein, partial [Patescibacteria group bacterium]